MNFLAHFYLSGGEAELEVGSFLGDFVRRKDWEKFSPRIQQGIQLHHQIDEFTDTHDIVRQSRLRLFTNYRHYSRVIVDLLYDHFLSKHFGRYSATASLQQFSASVYTNLKPYASSFPERGQDVFASMSKYDWLYHYQLFDEGFGRSLRSMSRRSSGKIPFGDSLELIREEYSDFESEFFLFFEQLMAFAEEQRKSL